MSTPEDLAETVRLVEALDRRIYSQIADVRDKAALQSAGLIPERTVRPPLLPATDDEVTRLATTLAAVRSAS